MSETWKPVKGFEEFYEISNTGKIKTLRLNKIMKPSLQKTGYYQCSLTLNKKLYYRYIHRLVAENFLKFIPNKYCVNHKDGNKTNNKVSNLEYCTMGENNKHAGLMNLKPIGTKHTNSKLTKQDLIKIEKLLSSGEFTHKKIAEIFEVSRSVITCYSNGKTYRKENLNE